MRRPTNRGERGSITPFVAIISLALLLLAGLVVDGGRQMNARGRAIAYAQEAARAGAQAVDLTDPRLDLDGKLALRAAADYCAAAQANDDQLIRCDAALETSNTPAGSFTVVQVDAQVQINAIVLGAVGRHQLTSSGTAQARPVSGITDADTGKIATIGPPSVGAPSDPVPTGTAPPTPPEAEVTPCTPRDDEDDESDDPEPTRTPSPPRPTRTPDPDEPEPCATPEE